MRYLFVVRILRRVVERFRAQIAFERPFAGVRSYVVNKRSPYFEFFRTHMTRVRIEIVVKAFVRYQRVPGYERFSANFARKRSFAGVNTSMFFARLFRVKALATNVAFVVTYIQVNIFYVRIQLMLRFRLFTAQIARELRFRIVTAVMGYETIWIRDITITHLTMISDLAVYLDLGRG